MAPVHRTAPWHTIVAQRAPIVMCWPLQCQRQQHPSHARERPLPGLALLYQVTSRANTVRPAPPRPVVCVRVSAPHRSRVTAAPAPSLIRTCGPRSGVAYPTHTAHALSPPRLSHHTCARHVPPAHVGRCVSPTRCGEQLVGGFKTMAPASARRTSPWSPTSWETRSRCTTW